MIVLDTNVLSETLRPRPADAVGRWMAAQPPTQLFTTAISEAELRYGLAVMPAGRRRTGLEHAITAILEQHFVGRILPFDSAAAQVFADIAAKRRASGRPIGDFDAQIVAIAAAHGASVATRNVDDFTGCGVAIVSPWDA